MSEIVTRTFDQLDPLAQLDPSDLLAAQPAGSRLQSVTLGDLAQWLAGLNGTGVSYYPVAAEVQVPRGVTGIGAVTPGAGGTNGVFTAVLSGGNFIINPTIEVTVTGGAVAGVTITAPGEYFGGAPVPPVINFGATSAGLAGAACPLVVGNLLAEGGRYFALNALGTAVRQYQVVAGMPVLVDPVISLPVSAAAQAALLAPLIAPLLPPALRGDPGANVMASGPRAGIAGVTIPAGTNLVMTDGAAASGDLGHGIMTLDTEQTARTSVGTALIATAVSRGQSSISATEAVDLMESRIRRKDVANRWFRARSPITDHRAFALAGDTARDTIQAMIDLYHYWRDPGGKVAGGHYVIDQPLWLARGDTFRQYNLQGAGRRYAGASWVSNGTLLEFTDPNLPGLIAQGFRDCLVSDCTIKGPHYAVLNARQLGKASPVDGAGNPIDDTDISSWYAALGITQKRHAPNAAYALDPFVGAAPTGGGADAPYVIPAANSQPAWFGPLALYNRFSSSAFRLDCEIFGWETGIAINSSTLNYQTDFVRASSVQITHCIRALDVGADQGRLNNLRECLISGVHTAISNANIGVQRGRMAAALTMSVGETIRMLDLNMSHTGSLSIEGYSELLWNIGNVTASTAAGVGALKLHGEWHFLGHPLRRGTPPWLLGSATLKGAGVDYVPVQISGQIVVEEVAPLLVNRLTIPSLQLMIFAVVSGWWENGSGHVLSLADNTERRRRKMAHNGSMGLATARMVSRDFSIVGTVCDVDGAGNAFVELQTNSGPYGFTHRKYGIPHWQRQAQAWGYDVNSHVETVTMPRRSGLLPKSATTGWSALVGKRYTFTLPAYFQGAFEYSARAANIAPGRFWVDGDTGMCGWVVDVNYATGVVVIECISNLYQPVGGAVYAHRLPMQTAVGNLHFIETAFFMPAFTLIGDVTAGSAVVTNLRRPDGDFAWLTNATYSAQHPQAGDWLFNDLQNPTANPFRNGAAKLTAFDGAARTMTMSAVTSLATTAGVAFALFRRGD